MDIKEISNQTKNIVKEYHEEINMILDAILEHIQTLEAQVIKLVEEKERDQAIIKDLQSQLDRMKSQL